MDLLLKSKERWNGLEMMYWIVKMGFILLLVASAALAANQYLLVPHSLRHLWVISQFIIFLIWKLSDTKNDDECLHNSVLDQFSCIRPLAAAELPETWYDVVPSFPSPSSSSTFSSSEPLPPEVTKEMVEPLDQHKSLMDKGPTGRVLRRHCREEEEEVAAVVIEEEMGWRRRRREVVVVNQDELFQRAEAFIKKHYDNLRLQRQASERRRRRSLVERLPWSS